MTDPENNLTTKHPTNARKTSGNHSKWCIANLNVSNNQLDETYPHVKHCVRILFGLLLYC